jgi:hypothetical protein
MTLHEAVHAPMAIEPLGKIRLPSEIKCDRYQRLSATDSVATHVINLARSRLSAIVQSAEKSGLRSNLVMSVCLLKQQTFRHRSSLVSNTADEKLRREDCRRLFSF